MLCPQFFRLGKVLYQLSQMYVILQVGCSRFLTIFVQIKSVCFLPPWLSWWSPQYCFPSSLTIFHPIMVFLHVSSSVLRFTRMFLLFPPGFSPFPVLEFVPKCTLVQYDCRILYQYLWKETISVLDFLHKGSHQREIACMATTFAWVLSGMPSHVQTCLGSLGVSFIRQGGDMSALKIIHNER